MFDVKNTRVYVCQSIVDMRKGFDGLYGLVKEYLHQDPLSGHLFLFVGRDCKRMKLLYWDGTGLCLFHKRLSKGRFNRFWDNTQRVLEITTSELRLFIEGCRLKGKMPLSPGHLEL
jgi:transposase